MKPYDLTQVRPGAWYNTQQVADILGIDRRTVKRKRDGGILHFRTNRLSGREVISGKQLLKDVGLYRI